MEFIHHVSWDEKYKVARFKAEGVMTEEDGLEMSRRMKKIKDDHPSCEFLLVDGTAAKFVKGTKARKVISDGVSVFKHHAIFGTSPTARMIIKVINKLGKSRSRVEYIFFNNEEEALEWLNEKRGKE